MSNAARPFAKCRVASNAKELNGLNRIFANKGNRKKGLGHLYIISTSFHFFIKTNFKQYRYLFIDMHDHD